MASAAKIAANRRNAAEKHRATQQRRLSFGVIGTIDTARYRSKTRSGKRARRCFPQKCSTSPSIVRRHRDHRGLKAYLDSEMQQRDRFLPLMELSHCSTAKQTHIQQALEPRYNRKGIFHLTVAGQNQCADLEEELLSFPKSPNDDTSDSAAYQVEVAQPPNGQEERRQVQETRERLTQNQSR